MQSRRSLMNLRFCRMGRNGFLYVPALREIIVVGLLGTFAVALICQTDVVVQRHLSAKKQGASNVQHDPVMALSFDQDRQTLLVHSWSKKLEEICVVNGQVSNKPVDTDLVSIETSQTNSTTIALSHWGDGKWSHHCIDITRQDAVLVSEDLVSNDFSVADVRISCDGSVAVFVSQAGHVVGWDLKTIEPSRWEYNLDELALTNRISPDGQSLLVVSKKRDVLVYDVHTGELRKRFPQIDEYSCCVTWSRDNQHFAVGDQSGMVHVFNLLSGECLWKVKIEFLFSRVLALSANGSRVIVGGFDRDIRIWDWIDRPDAPQILKGGTAMIRDFVLTDSDTKLICGYLDGTIREWSLETLEQTRQIR